MQKKLMAVAVAGVLGAPAVALAQTSTVQIFGTMYAEYAWIDQGQFGAFPFAPATAGAGTRQDVDLFQTPGSEIGFKGEEKLGGGLSAWFQCTSTADIRGQSGDGWCQRNSALGLKGGFGNVFAGNWDTPFKRTASPTNIGGNDTGVWGTANLLFAGSTTYWGIGGTAAAPANNKASFKRRQNNMIMFDSPSFGGFQVMTGFTASNHATNATEFTTNSKPRIMSIAAQYSAGPLYVGAGYERHTEFGQGTPNAAAVTPAATGGNTDDKGWHIGAAYTWGPVRFGGQYTRQKWELSNANGASIPPVASAGSKVNAWHVGVDWRIAGPHGLRAAYTKAGDMKGTPGAGAVAGSQGQTRPAVPAAGAANDTGADMWQVRYVYTFSKRTELNFGYVKLDNDGGGGVGVAGGTYNLFGVGGGGAPGNNQDAWALGVRHTF